MKRKAQLVNVAALLAAPASTSRAHSSSVGVNGPVRCTATRPGGQVIAPRSTVPAWDTRDRLWRVAGLRCAQGRLHSGFSVDAHAHTLHHPQLRLLV